MDNITQWFYDIKGIEEEAVMHIRKGVDRLDDAIQELDRRLYESEKNDEKVSFDIDYVIRLITTLEAIQLEQFATKGNLLTALRDTDMYCSITKLKTFRQTVKTE